MPESPYMDLMVFLWHELQKDACVEYILAIQDISRVYSSSIGMPGWELVVPDGANWDPNNGLWGTWRHRDFHEYGESWLIGILR